MESSSPLSMVLGVATQFVGPQITVFLDYPTLYPVDIPVLREPVDWQMISRILIV